MMKHKRAMMCQLLAVLVLIHSVYAQRSIRKVDFRNFSYPWSDYAGWPHELKWLDASEAQRVDLVDGKWRYEEDDTDAADNPENRPFSGLTLEQVQFADVTGDGREEAIVVLRYDSGGTQYSPYVYIYSFKARKPQLMSHFHSGDRAASGLYRVYGQGGKLIVELFDESKRSGDCCSEGFIRKSYKWREGKFQPVGAQESGAVETPSRLPATVFGMHQ